MRNRKKTFGKFILSLLLWLLLLVLVIGFAPTGYFVLLFFLLLFLSVYSLLSLFIPLALTLSLGVLGLTLLRFFHMDNSLNLILLLAMVVSFGLYQSKK